MKTIPFDLKYRPEIESGECKLVTREGFAARIVCWDAKGDWPIVALYDDNGDEYVKWAHEDGRRNDEDSRTDLLIQIDEPEEEEESLTEFEEAFKRIVLENFGAVVDETVAHNIKPACKALLDIARKDYETEIELAYKTADEVQYQKGYRKGIEDCGYYNELSADMDGVSVPETKPYINIKMPSDSKKNGHICVICNNLTYQYANVIKKMVHSWR